MTWAVVHAATHATHAEGGCVQRGVDERRRKAVAGRARKQMVHARVTWMSGVDLLVCEEECVVGESFSCR